jgi:hypothetical protein
MALTWPRWVAMALAGALVVAGICFSSLARPEPPVTAERALQIESEMLSRTTWALASRYRVLVLRDSLRAAGRLTPKSAGQTVIVDPHLDGAARLEIESALRRANILANVPAPRIPTVVAFVIDTARSVNGAPRSSQLAVHYLLPRDSVRACTVLVRVGRLGSSSLRQVTRRFHSDAFVTGLLGPCAFFAAFGEPGIGVARWLRSTGFAFTLAADWSIPVRADRLRTLHYLRDAQFVMDDWHPGDGLAHCLAREAQPCSTEIVAPRRRDGAAVWGGVVDQNRGYDFSNTGWRGVGAALLSDMAREYGEDKFARFWRSDRLVGEAFREATGEDLGTAAVRAIAERFPPMETGPDLSTKPLLNGLALLTLGLIGTFVAAARTRVV